MQFLITDGRSDDGYLEICSVTPVYQSMYKQFKCRRIEYRFGESPRSGPLFTCLSGYSAGDHFVSS